MNLYRMNKNGYRKDTGTAAKFAAVLFLQKRGIKNVLEFISRELNLFYKKYIQGMGLLYNNCDGYMYGIKGKKI